MSRVEHKLIMVANDPKKGMTLLELTNFVQAAVDLGLDLRTPLSAFVGWHSQLRKITIEMKGGN